MVAHASRSGTNSRRCAQLHLQYLVEVVRSSHAAYRSPAEALGAAAFAAEWDNVRSALDWAVGTGDLTSSADVLESTFWFATCWFRFEHAEWVENWLQRASTTNPDRSTMLGLAAGWRIHAGDPAGAIDLAVEGLDRPVLSDRARSWCLQALAMGQLFLGDGQAALETAQDSVSAATGDVDLECIALRTAVLAAGAAAPGQVRDLADRHRVLALRLDAPFERAHSAYFRGYSELALGRQAEALLWFQKCAATSRRHRTVHGERGHVRLR